MPEGFVSIHVPAYNEPPTLLKNTLRALSELDYKDYEVIIIDNNTKEEKIWRPIQEYCQKLRKTFKFFHIDRLPGFKAGALNYIQSKVNPKTKFVAVIDADYQVKPDFLKKALKYFTNNKIALVQFPQAYKNVNEDNLGISMEYEYFFRTYMNMANHFHCATSTGTLTIYRLNALKEVNLFSEESVTEDADIGVRLLRAGYETIYVPEIIGRGLMPFDIEAYKKQKARWSLGNAQILRKQFLQILLDNKLTILQKVGLMAQLTAWINFIFIPTLVIILGAFIKVIIPLDQPTVALSINIAILTLYIFLTFQLLSFVLGFRHIYSWKRVLRGFLVHLGMSWEYSTTFLKIFTKKDTTFERTNKFILPKIPDLIKNTAWELILGLTSFVLAITLVIDNELFHASALLLVSTTYFLIFFVCLEIKQTKSFSSHLINKMEKSFYGS
ncbi:MAG: glycosyltransferase [bacterium]|nr:glycosyltransferase [bacterium]